MSKHHDQTVRIGRRGAPTNLRAGGAMASANRKRDNRRNRRSIRQAVHEGEWE